MKLPADLMDAFRAMSDADTNGIASLLIDDGFDALTMRVLAAWTHLEHHWARPSAPCPDAGSPSPAAWTWLWSGHRFSAVELARSAGVSIVAARDKAEMLIGNHLVFPDGSISKPARAALGAHARRALGLDKKRDKTERKGGQSSGGDQGAN